MKRILLIITCAASFSLFQASNAVEFSVGLMAGQSTNEFPAESCEFDRLFYTLDAPGVNFNCSVDDSDTSTGINLSLHLTDMWGLEAGYIDFGEYSSFVTGSGDGFFISTGTQQTIPETINESALYAVGTITWNFANQWFLTGRLGGAEISTDLVSEQLDIDFSVDDTVAMGGLSVGYRLSSSWELELRYDYFDIDLAIDNTAFELAYRF